ncbi:SpoIIAA family protein [Spartinivicinus ruber]|uniref:STAS/SEC14 domain-containing protein n=1 Tax=Spartinivicinus ruber TaxID=2683272 RepID=UPI0013D720E6|nr:STAS/SEC14 domain-containing protein [Spartinivicinus ruber]
MISIDVDENAGIAILEPHGALSAEDFKRIADTIDPMIEKSGELKGLLIHSKSFPGWESFSGFISHIKFVRDHHQLVRKVAICTDSHLADLARYLGAHFIKAEVVVYPFNKLDEAKSWVSSYTLPE